MSAKPRLSLTRREALAGLGLLLGAGVSRPALATAAPGIVVIGGGFAGVTFARTLRRLAPNIDVTLVTPDSTYTACPFSNLVIAGLRDIAQQRFGYAALAREGIRVVHDKAIDVDHQARTVRLRQGGGLHWDRLVMAPGIDLRWDALPGYDRAAAELMPHAWQAGAQTLLLRRQLEAMPDGGLVVMTVPDNPYRCPPGPYERASLIAHYLAHHKPRAKLLVLDAKDTFSKQPLFQAAWQHLYGDRVEWQGLSAGGKVVAVDVRAGRIETDFDAFTPAVANVIPPQRAAAIAERAGVTDASGWCPIDAVTFESTLQPGIHVLGDAAIANAMPKSAFAASAQARVCAIQVARLAVGEAPLPTTLANTCWSLVAPDYAISVAGVYRPDGNRFAEVEGAGGTSPLEADDTVRALEAGYAHDWFRLVTGEVFG